MKPVGDLLHRKIGRLEQAFYFEHDRPIDMRLDRFVRRVAYDGGQIAGRNAQLVGIARNAALAETMLLDECDEPSEQFALVGRKSGGPMLLVSGREALHLVVGF